MKPTYMQRACEEGASASVMLVAMLIRGLEIVGEIGMLLMLCVIYLCYMPFRKGER